MTSIVISRQAALDENKKKGNENVNKHVCGGVYGRRNEQTNKQVKDCESSSKKTKWKLVFALNSRSVSVCDGF